VLQQDCSSPFRNLVPRRDNIDCCVTANSGKIERFRRKELPVKKRGAAAPLHRSDRGDITYIECRGASKSCPVPEKNNVVEAISSLHSNSPSVQTIHERWVTIDRARMRYLCSGSGPAILLVHGFLGYSFSWRFTIPALATRATVYAVDMMGTGYSDHPKNLDCSMRASAERLLHFLDAVGVSSCDLLGTSHGGAVAMMAASLSPERFRRLILVAPANPWSAYGKGLTRLLTITWIEPWFFRLLPSLEALNGFFLRRMYGDPRRIRSGTLEGYSAALRISGAFRSARLALRCWNRDLETVGTALPRISHLPTLLIWGSMDTAVSLASARRLRQQFVDCQLVTFDGVGHLPYEEVPEQFNQTVIQFLDSRLPGNS
jgi:pimeloyl-ACP methyl ester carboxylesterase